MAGSRQGLTHSTGTSNLADILERVLDKGIVIAGDIKVKLVDIELLTIQVRLMIASVDKAREMGMDWWVKNPDLSSTGGRLPAAQEAEIGELKRRIQELEQRAAPVCLPAPAPVPAPAS
jgi:gas vesicle protein GvpA/GvpJ/GvpM family